MCIIFMEFRFCFVFFVCFLHYTQKRNISREFSVEISVQCRTNFSFDLRWHKKVLYLTAKLKMLATSSYLFFLSDVTTPINIQALEKDGKIVSCGLDSLFIFSRCTSILGTWLSVWPSALLHYCSNMAKVGIIKLFLFLCLFYFFIYFF